MAVLIIQVRGVTMVRCEARQQQRAPVPFGLRLWSPAVLPRSLGGAVPAAEPCAPVDRTRRFAPGAAT